MTQEYSPFKWWWIPWYKVKTSPYYTNPSCFFLSPIISIHREYTEYTLYLWNSFIAQLQPKTSYVFLFHFLTQPKDHEITFIFPTKYVISRSLKVGLGLWPLSQHYLNAKEQHVARWRMTTHEQGPPRPPLLMPEMLRPTLFHPKRIHGNGIFTYIFTIKINHSCIGKYTIFHGILWDLVPTANCSKRRFDGLFGPASALAWMSALASIKVVSTAVSQCSAAACNGEHSNPG